MLKIRISISPPINALWGAIPGHEDEAEKLEHLVMGNNFKDSHEQHASSLGQKTKSMIWAWKGNSMQKVYKTFSNVIIAEIS